VASEAKCPNSNEKAIGGGVATVVGVGVVVSESAPNAETEATGWKAAATMVTGESQPGGTVIPPFRELIEPAPPSNSEAKVQAFAICVS
jgi:hypothetical protein